MQHPESSHTLPDLLYLEVILLTRSWSPESRIRRSKSLISFAASELVNRYLMTAFFQMTICFLKAFSILKIWNINTFTEHLFFEEVDRIDSFVIDWSFASKSHVIHVQLKLNIRFRHNTWNHLYQLLVYLDLGSGLISLNHNWFSGFVMDPHRWFWGLHTWQWLLEGCKPNFAKYLQ